MSATADVDLKRDSGKEGFCAAQLLTMTTEDEVQRRARAFVKDLLNEAIKEVKVGH